MFPYIERLPNTVTLTSEVPLIALPLSIVLTKASLRVLVAHRGRCGHNGAQLALLRCEGDPRHAHSQRFATVRAVRRAKKDKPRAKRLGGIGGGSCGRYGNYNW